MAKTKTYKISYDSGPDRYLKLGESDLEAWQKLAADKTTRIKSVTAGSPTPINATGSKA